MVLLQSLDVGDDAVILSSLCRGPSLPLAPGGVLSEKEVLGGYLPLGQRQQVVLTQSQNGFNVGAELIASRHSATTHDYSFL